MAKWNRKRIAGWAAAIILSIFLPVALAQNYFRYNPYVLPICGLVAILFYICLCITSKTALDRIRALHQGFGTKRPLEFVLAIAGAGVLLFALLAGTEWYAISLSAQHVAELEKEDSHVTTSAQKSEKPVFQESQRDSTQPEEPAPIQRRPTVQTKTLAKAEPFHATPTESGKPESPQSSLGNTPSVINNAPGGIVNSGSIGEATVNNYAPAKRRLTSEQQAIIAESMLGLCHSGVLSVSVMWEPDSEAAIYAGDLISPLASCGCVALRKAFRDTPNRYQGLTLITDNWDHPNEIAKTLDSALSKAQISFRRESGDSNAHKVALIVGIN